MLAARYGCLGFVVFLQYLCLYNERQEQEMQVWTWNSFHVSYIACAYNLKVILYDIFNNFAHELSLSTLNGEESITYGFPNHAEKCVDLEQFRF